MHLDYPFLVRGPKGSVTAAAILPPWDLTASLNINDRLLGKPRVTGIERVTVNAARARASRIIACRC